MNSSLKSTVISACLLITFMVASYASGSAGLPERDSGQRATYWHHNGTFRAGIDNRGVVGQAAGAQWNYGFRMNNSSEFLYSCGFWVGAKIDDEDYVSTTMDGDNGTVEFAPSIDGFRKNSSHFNQYGMHEQQFEIHYSLIANDEDGDWNVETDDLDDNGRPSSNWDGDEDANRDGNPEYDPEPHMDEDPIEDISHDLIDNDHDGMIDEDDDDLDGDQVPGDLDDDGDGLQDEDGFAQADEEVLAIYDDTDIYQVAHPDNDGHTPLNIRIEQTTYSWTNPDQIKPVLFVEEIIRNIGNETLEGLCLGIFADPDIAAANEQGDVASLDDWVFFNEELRLAVAGDDTTDGDRRGPGVYGIKLLATSDTGDDFTTSFSAFNRTAGGDPENDPDKYEIMNRDHIDDPTARTDDWRFVMGLSSPDADRPWSLEPGETFKVTWAMIGAEDIGELEEIAGSLQEYFDAGRSNYYLGDYLPIAPAPRVQDVGDGSSLLVSWPDFRALHPFANVRIIFEQSNHRDSITVERDDREILLSQLEANETVIVQLELLDEEGNSSGEGDSTSLTPRITPLSPAGLSIIGEDFHSITIAWQANQELDLNGYNIYREAGANREKINNEPVADTFYIDHLDSFDVYYYLVTAVDNDGNESPVAEADSVSGAPFIIEPGKYLIIDETRNGNGRPGSPDDSQVDDFYSTILDGYGFESVDFDEIVQNNPRSLRAIEIGKYSLIIWHADDKSNLNLKASSEILSRFVEIGGKLVISGWDVLGQWSVNDSVIFEEGSIESRLFGLERAQRDTEREFVGMNGIGQYTDMMSDSSKLPPNWMGMLDRGWVFEPIDGADDFTSIGNFLAGVNNSPFNDRLTAYTMKRGDGNIALLGFPLYFINLDDATNLFRSIIGDWLSFASEEQRLSPNRLYLAEPYPNPFNSSTVITFSLPVTSSMCLSVYDLIGREITVLASGNEQAGIHNVVWKADGFGSGLYFVRLESGGKTMTQKVLLVK